MKRDMYKIIITTIFILNAIFADPKYGYSDELAAIDPYNYVSINSIEDLQEKHQILNEYFWGNSGFPYKKQPQYESEVFHYENDTILPIDLRKISKEIVYSITKITVVVDYEYKHVSYFIRPKKINTKPCLAIIHQGHQGGVKDGIDNVCNIVLERGMYVLLMQMPLVGWNKCNRWVLSDREIIINGVSVVGHNKMLDSLKNLEGSPLKYFIEPVIVGVNYFINRYPNYQYIAMIGLSGGGWTTHIASALDNRISMSIAVAGSYPLYVRPFYPGSEGDAEQVLPELYEDRASWLDLYIMSSHGYARKHIQLLNKFDTCCFYGLGIKSYQSAIDNVVGNCGEGEWLAEVDSTHRSHKISEWAIDNVIIPNLDYFNRIHNAVVIISTSQRYEMHRPQLAKLLILAKAMKTDLYTITGRKVSGKIMPIENVFTSPVIYLSKQHK